eukprot:scaffold154928_cov18-Tisochrysis_lutea.AAC.2
MAAAAVAVIVAPQLALNSSSTSNFITPRLHLQQLLLALLTMQLAPAMSTPLPPPPSIPTPPPLLPLIIPMAQVPLKLRPMLCGWPFLWRC